jgi:N-acetylmuramic acid 6-phosphate (MurNAc-6-P) etherase
VAEAGNVEESRAAWALDEAAGSVAVAIVMVRLDVERSRAEQLLEAAGGRTSVALGEQ